MLYSIIFHDGSKFFGGDYINTKWGEIPNKPIKTIFHSLPFGDSLALSGYDAYHHYGEIAEDVMGGRKVGIPQLEYLYLIGKKKNMNRVYRISIKTGQIKISTVNDDDELIKQLNPAGWKNGKAV